MRKVIEYSGAETKETGLKFSLLVERGLSKTSDIKDGDTVIINYKAQTKRGDTILLLSPEGKYTIEKLKGTIRPPKDIIGRVTQRIRNA
ncbi:MAG: hypothetical protein BWX78_01440 [Firmicutes bacterium ADurb.Bin099]|nr:MAG: hypothetical protein BWX78_01440 [Firmicutes bacterium ADurb.Bin099]